MVTYEMSATCVGEEETVRDLIAHVTDLGARGWEVFALEGMTVMRTTNGERDYYCYTLVLARRPIYAKGPG